MVFALIKATLCPLISMISIKSHYNTWRNDLDMIRWRRLIMKDLGGVWLGGVGAWNGWLPFKPFGWGGSHFNSNFKGEWEWPNPSKIQSQHPSKDWKFISPWFTLPKIPSLLTPHARFLAHHLHSAAPATHNSARHYPFSPTSHKTTPISSSPNFFSILNPCSIDSHPLEISAFSYLQSWNLCSDSLTFC